MDTFSTLIIADKKSETYFFSPCKLYKSRKRLKEQFEIFIKTAGILIVTTLWFNISQKFETINFRHYIPVPMNIMI